MIQSIHFENLKALRDATLPLSRFTLIVGPNGSGKSTALQGLEKLASAAGPHQVSFSESECSHGVAPRSIRQIQIAVEWAEDAGIAPVVLRWTSSGFRLASRVAGTEPPPAPGPVRARLQHTRVFSLRESAIAAAVKLVPGLELTREGGNLAGVLDRLRDEAPEQFELLNEEVGRLLPEFDRILFETPSEGHRAFMLRTRIGGHAVRAAALSQGTLLALAILTLSYLPNPPRLIGLEEPDRGIHPRLYRDVQDALYRLCYPEAYGLTRDPVQVIVTTHSPLLLDLHSEHPEEIVIAEKTETGAEFHRLSDREDLQELLADANLGEIWYSGILGGVPAAR